MSKKRHPLTESGSLAFPGAGVDLAEAARLWLRRLDGERRVSPLTLDAYGRDLRQFVKFLCDRFDSPVGLQQLGDVKPADLRAFMARRREDGVGSRSLLRQLAGLRSFSRYLDHEKLATIGVFEKVRTPKAPRVLPKALPAEKLKTLRRANWLKERPDRRGSAPATLRSFRCSTERAYVFPRPCRSDGLRRRSAMSIP